MAPETSRISILPPPRRRPRPVFQVVIPVHPDQSKCVVMYYPYMVCSDVLSLYGVQ